MGKRLKKMPKNPLNIVCCIVLDPNDNILLLRRHSEALGGSLWATPGGRQEPDEEPAQTAIREIQEETGLHLEAVEYLGAHEMRMPHGVAHMKSFKARVGDDEEIVIDPEEHDGHQWFEIANLLNEENIIWGLPTTLLDFGLIESFETDSTLADGSEAVLLEVSRS